MILFASHNFIKDPPFSRLHLISCRNVLIYLNHTAQERIMETFHFALNPGGFLFLGTSESIDGASDLYDTYDQHNHIFRTRPVTVKNYPVPESIPNLKLDYAGQRQKIHENGNDRQERLTYVELHQKLLEQYAPPSVVVNEEYEIVHMSDSVGKYFVVQGGEPSRNLLSLIRPELRMELRSALYQALQRKIPVEARDMQLNINGQPENINIHVKPALRNEDPLKGFILVVFEYGTAARETTKVTLSGDEPLAKQLEEELVYIKGQLRTSVEQHELQEEELKASNEELQAMNEELRSAAEELETSKEELQSINEELRTVNQELKVKIDETTLASNNLQNLINSAQVGTIFLDRNFRVKLFTPAVRDLFNLIFSDYGRPITDITYRLQYDNLLQDAEAVLEKLTIIEREINSTDGRVFMVRMLPYRTGEDRINGVVITFFDITKRSQAEEALRQSEERMRLLIESAKDYAILMLDTGGRFVSWSKGAELMFGYAGTEVIGELSDIIFTPEDREKEDAATELEKADKEGIAKSERWHLRKNGSRFWGSGSVSPLRNKEGILIGYVKIMRDLTESRREREALLESENRFRTLADAVPQVIWANDSDGKANYFNHRWFEYSGLTYEQSVGLGWEAIVHPDDAPASVERWHKALRKEEKFDAEYRLRRFDGTYRWHIGRNIPLKDASGRVLSWFGSATDIEDFKKAEEMARINAARLKIAMESAVDYAIIIQDMQGIIQGWSPGAEIIFGYKEEEVKGKSGDIIFTPEDKKAGVPQQEMNTAREKGRALDERWHIHRNGTRFFVSGVMAPIYDGALSGYVKVARDMTEQKAKEEKLRLSEERYRIALSSAEMGAWDWNVETNKLVWNEQHYIMLGLPPEEGEKDYEFFLSFVHPDDVDAINSELKKAANETGIFHAEFRMITNDEKVKWMNGYGRAVLKQGTKATRIVGVMYDITGRRQLEQQKDDFIGIASHELKTPVTSIKGYAEVLQEMFTEANNPVSAELMHKLDVQVDRLTDLIRSLLDTTKISEGQLVLYPEVLDMNDLISERIKDLSYISNKHQLVFKPGKLKNVTADKERIGQVITNLVTNAVKYSPRGGEVLITSRQLKETVEVSVHDEGIGIPEESQDKVFGRFFRISDPLIDTFPGMGLGLYISAGIVRRHGGNISFSSKPGEGSEFSFEIPVG